MGQIPDKHVFAAWKYLGAETQRQYEYCWMERRENAIKQNGGITYLEDWIDDFDDVDNVA